MPRKKTPLLCELHAHTRWSDGALSLRELVDLSGRNGFDVLAVTHVLRADDPWCDATGARPTVDAARFAAYLEIEDEAERARRRYDLLVLPGRAPGDVEDDASVREVGGFGRGLPALAAARLPGEPRRRRGARPRCVSHARRGHGRCGERT